MSKTSKALMAYLDCRPPGDRSGAGVGQKSESLRTWAGSPFCYLTIQKAPQGMEQGALPTYQCQGDAQCVGTASHGNQPQGRKEGRSLPST